MQISTRKDRILQASTGKGIRSLLIISTFLGYLVWGGEHHAFIFQVEAVVFGKLFNNPAAILHPLIILPLIGQILLVWTLFQAVPSGQLTVAGIVSIGLLFLLILFISIITLNPKMFFSTIPFFVFSVIILVSLKRAKRNI